MIYDQFAEALALAWLRRDPALAAQVRQWAREAGLFVRTVDVLKFL